MSEMDSHTALALLEWQIELGADEAIGDTPVNRYELATKPPAPKPEVHVPAQASAPVAVDAIAIAKAAADRATDLDSLNTALAGYEHCDLRRGARNLVFADGQPEARVMIIGEAPGRDEDRVGKPFVGRAGQLLNKMFDAIGLNREAASPANAFYITNVLPWRPPQNRDPKPEEIAMMLPFVQRHVDLADPDFIVLMGNISCQAGLGQRGITRLRGNWAQAYGKPALPMFHPAYLLRNPQAKREAWADLLSLQARMEQGQ
jgi:DNA polymerase